VGVIPVTVYPMTDAVGATAATGDITPSGTASFAAQYVFRIGGVSPCRSRFPPAPST
jgi:hypothetical protein